MAVKIIDLDVWLQSWQYASAIKGEVNSRFLELHFCQDSKPYDLTNKIIDAYAKKPDGTEIDDTVDILDAQNGIATFKLTSQISAVVGTLNFVFNIRGSSPISNESVTGLHLEILEGMNEDGVISSNEFTVLQTALGSIQQSVIDAQKAIVDANTAVDRANQAYDGIDVAVTKANTATSQANLARDQANIATNNANQAATEVRNYYQMTDPFTGQMNYVASVVLEIYEYLFADSIKASEFDVLNITASDFDNKNISAIDFDMKAKQLLT